MHELGITDQLLTLVLQHAKEAEAIRVTHLHLVIGEFASVVDDSLQFYWDMLTEGTIAEDAQLHFERIPGKMVCQDCQHEYLFADFEGVCPTCNGVNIKVIDGKQFQLSSIEIEKRSEAESDAIHA